MDATAMQSVSRHQVVSSRDLKGIVRQPANLQGWQCTLRWVMYAQSFPLFFFKLGQTAVELGQSGQAGNILHEINWLCRAEKDHGRCRKLYT